MSKGTAESARLLELHQAHVKAWNEFDLGVLGQIYDSECYIFDTIPPPVFRSLREFLEYLTPALQSFNDFTLRTFDQIVRVDERRGDRIGWIASRYEIYEKREGDWKLIHLHSSDDPTEG